MKFNDTDLSKYGAKQYRNTFGQTSLSNDTEWLRDAPLPIFDNNYRQGKEIKTEILVYGSSREDIRQNISNILALCLEPVEIELDGYDHKFKGILKSSSVSEGSDMARERYQHMVLTFEGYEHGTNVTVSGTNQITITNPGNVISPAIVEITPTIGISSLTVSGICRNSFNGVDLPVALEKLSTGNTVIIDGIAGLVTEANALKEVDMWTLPTLVPGVNTITLDNDKLTTKVTVLPIYI